MHCRADEQISAIGTSHRVAKLMSVVPGKRVRKVERERERGRAGELRLCFFAVPVSSDRLNNRKMIELRKKKKKEKEKKRKKEKKKKRKKKRKGAANLRFVCSSSRDPGFEIFLIFARLSKCLDLIKKIK